MRGLLEQGKMGGIRGGDMSGAGGQQPITVPGTALPLTAPTTAEPEQAQGLLMEKPNQQEIDIFVANGLKLVHTPKVSDAVIALVVKAKDPIRAVAEATLNIVARLEQSANSSGKKFSLSTLAYGTNYIMGEIIASAETAGMKKMDDREKYRAFSLAVAQYLDNAIKTGKITKEEILRLGKEAEKSPIGQKMGMTMQQGAGGMEREPGTMPMTGEMGGQNGRVA